MADAEIVDLLSARPPGGGLPEVAAGSVSPTSADPAAHPPCLVCGGVVHRRRGETPSEHKRRQLCSPECISSYRADSGKVKARQRHGTAAREAAAAKRCCEVCGTRLTRHGNESLKKFEVRRTCCAPECVKEVKKRIAAEIDWRFVVEVQDAKPTVAPESEDFGEGFGKFDLRFRNGIPPRISGPPINRTIGGVSW